MFEVLRPWESPIWGLFRIDCLIWNYNQKIINNLNLIKSYNNQIKKYLCQNQICSGSQSTTLRREMHRWCPFSLTLTNRRNSTFSGVKRLKKWQTCLMIELKQSLLMPCDWTKLVNFRAHSSWAILLTRSLTSKQAANRALNKPLSWVKTCIRTALNLSKLS